MQRGVRWSDTYHCVCMHVRMCVLCLPSYAACVFAYGQTGSGKTYTVSGLEEKIGMCSCDGACLLMLTQHAVLGFATSC